MGGVLEASASAIAQATSQAAFELIEAHQQLLSHSLRDRLRDAPLTMSGDNLTRYLIATLGDRKTEIVRAFFLDAGNRLLADEEASVGDAGGASLSIRGILNRALELHAVGLLIVHNHPGGSPRPSPKDLDITQKLARAGEVLGVMLIDHIIVAGDQCVSLRAGGQLA